MLLSLHTKKIRAAFFEAASGAQPVRDWLKDMPAEDRKVLGEDIAVVEFTWPIGMPLRFETGALGSAQHLAGQAHRPRAILHN
jgi:hypothetical protein